MRLRAALGGGVSARPRGSGCDAVTGPACHRATPWTPGRLGKQLVPVRASWFLRGCLLRRAGLITSLNVHQLPQPLPVNPHVGDSRAQRRTPGDIRVATSHCCETRCIVSPLRPGSCVQPLHLVLRRRPAPWTGPSHCLQDILV